MAITTYGELQTAIANWLQRSDLTSRLPEFIALAEDRVAHDLRIREMETTSDVTITASTTTTALPTNFLGLRRMYLNVSGAPRIDYYPPEAFWKIYDSANSGRPIRVTIEAGNFVWGPTPDSSYTAKALCWIKPTAWSATSDTNSILTNHTGLYLYGSLLEAALYLEDDAAAMKYAMRYQEEVERVKRSDRKDRYPAGQKSSRSEVGIV